LIRPFSTSKQISIFQKISNKKYQISNIK
jgi:hypothetical protein